MCHETTKKLQDHRAVYVPADNDSFFTCISLPLTSLWSKQVHKIEGRFCPAKSIFSQTVPVPAILFLCAIFRCN
ncbi:hypothetical protein CLOSTHATH_02313 [Hungatella hathewayi DSM 13479]|uniref:Uncharacterized protein n=1 Tax=Hungatella hathewayi DSM 13479 TaxID=566550 RepID=D3AFC9_9FIRM|nr:hypothetical protein CLOSTHATH_02313 [Hungatella hathewayi DSM 13479]